MTYVQLDNVNSDLMESKGCEAAFDPNIFTLITDGDESEIRDFEGTLTIEEVIAEASEGDRIVFSDDCPPRTIPPHSTTEKGYWAGETAYTV